MMWLLLLLANPHLVESQDEHRLILKNGSNPCEGYIQVYHEKKWGYVGAEALSIADRKVVCRSAQCGEPRVVVDMLLPPDSQLWLWNLKCNGSEKHLWDCAFSQWTASEYRGQTVEKITCSNTVKVALELPCLGRVQYFTNGDNQAGYICGEKFAENEGTVVCKSLGCGKLKEIPKWWMDSDQNKEMISTNCLGTENHLWECAPKAKSSKISAVVICEGHKVLRLKGNDSNVCSGAIEEQRSSWNSVSQHNVTILEQWCGHMYCGSYVNHTQDGSGTQLTCSDKVRVVLRDNSNKPSRCYGTVYMEVNGALSPVCGSSWTSNSENSNLVCRELGCGKALTTTEKSARDSRSLIDYVSCTSSDISLWHCKAKHSKQPFSCNNHVYLTCSGSVEVKLSDGPGKCAGRLAIFYEDKWQTPSNEGWTDINSKMICSHLDCGNEETGQKSLGTFTKGPQSVFNKIIECNQNSKQLFDCKFTDRNKQITGKEEVVSITCQGYKDIFLSDGFCSGDVGIHSSRQIHWLSGSADSWNKASADAVCREIRCGDADTFDVTKHNATDISVWKTHDCPSNLVSVFDCKNNISSPDTNGKDLIEIATVKCTGSKTINLTNTCWGYVNICEEGQCGGVCAETWTDAKAKMLCQQLGCGDPSVPLKKDNKNFQVDFKSVHLLHDKNSLTKSHIVRRNESDDSCRRNAAYVVCTGSYKSRFTQPKDHCSGNVHLYQEDQWLPVCDYVGDNTRNAMCGLLNCGHAVRAINYYGTSQNNEYISKLTCPEDSKSLKHCSASSNARSCTPHGLQCSDWKRLVLVKGEDACSGVVLVYSNNNNRLAVSAVGWEDRETQRLCEDLDCGKTGVSTEGERITDLSFWKGSFNCTNATSPQNIWGCEQKESPKEDKLLYIKCSESPTVNLTKKCHGEVLIDAVEVCESLWTDSYANLVCQEMKCGDAIPGINTLLPQSRSKMYQHVTCESYHNKLGQCRRFKGPCAGNLVTVSCTGNVKYKMSEKCGGDVEVSFDNKTWNKVCSGQNDDLPDTIQKQLCQEFQCGVPHDKRKNRKNHKIWNLIVASNCTKDHQHIKYCLSKKPCKGKKSQVFCTDYVDPDAKAKVSPVPVVPIILGLGLVLVVTLAIVLFLRYYLGRKNKTIKDFLPLFAKNNQKEEDFESGEYEDMPTKEGQDFDSHGLHAFTSVANAMAETNASSSSLAYDDVDEINEARPLTSEEPDHTQDANYEVDDPHDSYDDIDADTEVVHTEAEVHSMPSSPQEEHKEEAPDFVLGDDDYLVPGEEIEIGKI